MSRVTRQELGDYLRQLAETTDADEVKQSAAEHRVQGQALEAMPPEDRRRWVEQREQRPRTREVELWDRYIVRHYADPLMEQVRRNVARIFIEGQFDAGLIRFWAEELRG